MTSAFFPDGKISEILNDLRNEVAQILEQNSVKLSDAEGHLSHFTTLEGLTNILENYRNHCPPPRDQPLSLWLSDVSCLNDPLEGHALFEFVRDHTTARRKNDRTSIDFRSDVWRRLEEVADWMFPSIETLSNRHLSSRRADGTSRRILICSFTQDEDRLDLWRAYGANAAGFCLSMPLKMAVDRIRKFTSPTSQIYRVGYSNEEKATAWTRLLHHLGPLYDLIHEEIKRNSAKSNAVKAAVLAECEQLFHLYKHEQYQNEHEMRLITTYELNLPESFSNHSDGNFFATGVRVDLPLNRVYSYSDPFFFKGNDCKLTIGPRVRDAERYRTTLSSLLVQLWGRIDAPEVLLSEVPYR